MTLAELRVGETACICGMDISDSIKLRLMELGMIRGTRVKCVLKRQQRGMAAYAVRGGVFGIRAEDAEKIVVESTPVISTSLSISAYYTV